VRYEERGQGYCDVEKVGKHCPRLTNVCTCVTDPDIATPGGTMLGTYKRIDTAVAAIGYVLNGARYLLVRRARDVNYLSPYLLATPIPTPGV
jgi:hypothetical protein